MQENGKSIANDVLVLAKSIGRYAGSAKLCANGPGVRCASPQETAVNNNQVRGAADGGSRSSSQEQDAGER